MASGHPQQDANESQNSPGDSSLPQLSGSFAKALEVLTLNLLAEGLFPGCYTEQLCTRAPGTRPLLGFH